MNRFLCCLLFVPIAGGCQRNEVVIYVSLDREFSEPLFEAFEKETGIHVRAKYDSEANKTVGLTNLIIAEEKRPRCDLFWNNEVLNTLRLDAKQMLSSYDCLAAKDYPQQYQDENRRWFGFAARARVLLVNTDKINREEFPHSIYDLIDPKWKGETGFAKPLFGTTATHAACLFETLGEDQAKIFFRQLRQNAKVYPGNKQVALAVSTGQISFGLTDTDDAIVQIEQGFPLEIIYPDQAEDAMGTLFIPNTLCLIKNASNSKNAKKFMEFLLSPQSEGILAKGPSAQIPLNRKTNVDSQVATPKEIKPLRVNFRVAATKWEQVAAFLRSEFVAN